MPRRKSLFTKKNIKKIVNNYGEASVYGLILIDISIFFICLSIFDLGFLLPFIFFFAIGVLIFICSYLSKKNQKTISKPVLTKPIKIVQPTKINTPASKNFQKITISENKTNFENIDNLTGVEFEEFLCGVFKGLGYNVQLTQKTGDFGVDLIIELNGKKSIVQAKRYSKKVSVNAVQEITTARNHYNIFDAIIVTNNYFTSPAQQLALDNNITLINRDKLNDLIKKSKIENNSSFNVSYYNNSLIANNNYNNSFSDNIYDLQNSLISAINILNLEAIKNLSDKILSLDTNSKENLLSYHFLLNAVVKHLYKFRNDIHEINDYIIKFCNKDIETLKTLKTELSNVSILTLTKKAIILEKRKLFNEVIELCDFCILNNYLEESGVSFILRKNRILKKVEMKND